MLDSSVYQILNESCDCIDAQEQLSVLIANGLYGLSESSWRALRDRCVMLVPSAPSLLDNEIYGHVLNTVDLIPSAQTVYV